MNETGIAGLKEIVNTVGELVISLVIIIGGGWVMLSPGSGPDLRLLAGSSISLVLGVWFSQRGTAKAQNGTLTAMTLLATKQAEQISASQQATANIVASAISQNNGGQK